MKKVLLLLFGIGLLGAISYFCFLDKVDHIRQHILADVQHRLDDNGASWAKVKLKGEGLTATRELILEGNAPSSEAIQDARRLALLDKGVFKVINHAKVMPLSDTPKMAKLKESLIEKVHPKEENVTKEITHSKEKHTEPKPIQHVVTMPSRIDVVKDKRGTIYLKGIVPNLKSSEALVAYAKQQFGDVKVNNELTIGTDIGKVSVEDLKSALDVLKETKSGEFHLLDHNLTFRAEVESDAQKDRIERSIDKTFSHGYHLVSQLHATPKMKPLDVSKIVAEMMPEAKKDMASHHTGNVEEVNQTSEPVVKKEVQREVQKVVQKEASKVIEKEAHNEAPKVAQKEMNNVSQKECQEKINHLLKTHKIHFDYNKAHIKSQSYPLLNKLAEVFASCDLNHLVIAGHTDSDGSEGYNLKLSQKRADAVKVYLVKKGIKPDQVVALGYGESSPLVANDTAKHKARNRRIEFHIVSADELKKIQEDYEAYRIKVEGSKVKKQSLENVKDKTQEMGDKTQDFQEKSVPPMTAKHLVRCQNIINRILSEEKIYFTLNRKGIERASQKIAKRIAKLLKLCPNTEVTIKGYTDSIGTKEKNLEISRQKAETLKAFFIRQGVDAKRLKAEGLGETHPIADNETASGRAKNRRVEIILKEMK